MMTSLDAAAVALQMMSCAAMTGVIAIIQLIHYPSFYHVDRSQFARFHLRHTNALGLIAGPLMVLELISALWLASYGAFGMVLNLVCVLALWALTFLVSVPAHNRLAYGFDKEAWHRLVKTNWLRTALWCGRFLIFLYWLFALLKT